MYVQLCVREHKAKQLTAPPEDIYPRLGELVAKHKLSTIAARPAGPGQNLDKRLLSLTVQLQGGKKVLMPKQSRHSPDEPASRRAQNESRRT